MRRRIPYRVCSCTSLGVVTHLEARLLRQMVNREIHPIRCAESCRKKRQKAQRIGDLCAETGHFLWAIKVWYLGLLEICMKDYDEWRYVHFNNDIVCLDDVVSEEDAMILAALTASGACSAFPKKATMNVKPKLNTTSFGLRNMTVNEMKT